MYSRRTALSSDSTLRVERRFNGKRPNELCELRARWLTTGPLQWRSTTKYRKCTAIWRLWPTVRRSAVSNNSCNMRSHSVQTVCARLALEPWRHGRTQTDNIGMGDTGNVVQSDSLYSIFREVSAGLLSHRVRQLHLAQQLTDFGSVSRLIISTDSESEAESLRRRCIYHRHTFRVHTSSHLHSWCTIWSWSSGDSTVDRDSTVDSTVPCL